MEKRLKRELSFWKGANRVGSLLVGVQRQTSSRNPLDYGQYVFYWFCHSAGRSQLHPFLHPTFCVAMLSNRKYGDSWKEVCFQMGNLQTADVPQQQLQKPVYLMRASAFLSRTLGWNSNPSPSSQLGNRPLRTPRL